MNCMTFMENHIFEHHGHNVHHQSTTWLNKWMHACMIYWPTEWIADWPARCLWCVSQVCHLLFFRLWSVTTHRTGSPSPSFPATHPGSIATGHRLHRLHNNDTITLTLSLSLLLDNIRSHMPPILKQRSVWYTVCTVHWYLQYIDTGDAAIPMLLLDIRPK